MHPISIWFEKESEKYRGKWVALTAEAKLLASGDSPAELKEILKDSDEIYFTSFIKDPNIVYGSTVSIKF